jgi:hypothetical protein
MIAYFLSLVEIGDAKNNGSMNGQGNLNAALE